MTDTSDPNPGPDSVDQGKRLIRSGGDKGLSLAERISERLQRLAWRTPLHSVRLRGRYPLKLIAVADDPFFGDVARGQALLYGMVSHLGETQNLSGLNLSRPSFSPRFADYLHGFEWLRDLSSVTTRANAVPIAEAIMRQWLAAHADKVSDPAWRADLWGRRMLFWIAHAPLILSSSDLIYRSKVLNTLARGSRHLERTADKAPEGLPRVAAWCGIMASGLMIPGGDPRRGWCETGLFRAIDGAMFDDGGTIGRSPASQREMVMLLTMVRECYAARRLDPPERLQVAIDSLVAAMLGVCHGDGGLSSWQGAAPVSGEMIAQCVEASGARVRPLRQAREWGYQRLVGGKSVLVMDAAPPPLARVAEGGCASTLAFEFSDGPARVIVNCGGGRQAHVIVPPALAAGLRTTAAHSTLTLSDSNSTAIHPDGTLGKGVGEIELSRHEGENAARIEASHDGYVRRFGLIHRRQVTLSKDGGDVRGEDMLLPSGRKRKRGDVPFAIRFHLGAGVQASPTADGLAAFLRLPGGGLWQFRAKDAALSIEDSLWIGFDGRPRATSQIVLTGTAPAGGAHVSWVMHKAK